MKSTIQQRPQSKRVVSRHIQTRYINKEQAQDTFKKAKAKYQIKQYEQAIELYRHATINDPQYFQAYCNMGTCYRALGKFNMAIRQYQKSLKIKPDDCITRYNLGNAYRMFGDEQMAINNYNTVISQKQAGKCTDGVYFNSLVNIAICFKLLRKYETAIEYLNKAIAIHPDDEAALFDLAVCLSYLLDQSNITDFKELSKERCTYATNLLGKVLKINPLNQRAQILSIEMTYIIEKQESQVKIALQKYKAMLAAPNVVEKDQINHRMGFCLGILKEFQKSAKIYEELIKKQAQEKALQEKNKKLQEEKQKQKIEKQRLQKQRLEKQRIQKQKKQQQQKQAPKAQPPKQNKQNLTKKESKPVPPKFTQDQGLQLLQKQQYQELQRKIDTLQEGDLLKHSLLIIMYNQLSDKDSKNMLFARNEYQSWFVINNQSIPFDKISLQTHKAIAQLLTKEQQHEQAIKHYEYIANSYKSDKQKVNSAIIHNNIGSNYHQLGQIDKALEEYKLALSYQSENHIFLYNVGVTLMESGYFKDSLEILNKYLKLIAQNPNIPEIEKGQNIIDCQMFIALNSQKQQNNLSYFENTTKRIQKLWIQHPSSKGYHAKSALFVSFQLKLADIYQNKLKDIQDRLSQEYRLLSIKLIQCYQALLLIDECPDRDQILSNCGNLYYNLRLYANALVKYGQIQSPELQQYLSIALSSLHLYEHAMAVKFIDLAYVQDPHDPLIKFDRELIHWIYNIGLNEGSTGVQENRIAKKYPCTQDRMLNVKCQFAIGLLDKLTCKVNSFPSTILAQIEYYQAAITQLIQNDHQFKSINEAQNTKFMKIKSFLKNAIQHPHKTNEIPDELARLSLSRTKQVGQDFKKLIQKLKPLQTTSNDTNLISVLLSSFIYLNAKQKETILKLMHQTVKSVHKNKAIQVTLDKVIENSAVLKDRIPYSGNGLEHLLNELFEWEAREEESIRGLFQIIEEEAYQFDIVEPILTWSHFPRNSLIAQCDVTFIKIVEFFSKTLKLQSSASCKGENIGEMKVNLVKQYEKDFNLKIKPHIVNGGIELGFTSNYSPILMQIYIKSKEQASHLIKKLQTHSSHPKQIALPSNQITLSINNLINLRICWKNEHAVEKCMMQMLESPLDIALLSIFNIYGLLDMIREESGCVQELIGKEPTFKFN